MEVFYPNEFIRDRPQGVRGDWRNLYEGEEQQHVANIRVPILKLAHVTHDAEADEITTVNSYQFEVAENVEELAGVFLISGAQTEIGNYSWWSPYAHNYHLPHDHPNSEDCISPAQIAGVLPQHYYVANYLKHPSESIYGNRVFHADFSDLHDAYVRSRRSRHVFIKIGGTLRYTGEICFVLIVCTENDELVFPALGTNNEYFETNGLINDDGRVIDRNAIANFHPRHIIQWARPREHGETPYYSYITPAFAFYYPDEDGMLVLEGAKCHDEVRVEHTEAFCLKKVYGNCPNNSPRSDSDSNNSSQSDSDS